LTRPRDSQTLAMACLPAHLPANGLSAKSQRKPIAPRIRMTSPPARTCRGTRQPARGSACRRHVETDLAQNLRHRPDRCDQHRLMRQVDPERLPPHPAEPLRPAAAPPGRRAATRGPSGNSPSAPAPSPTGTARTTAPAARNRPSAPHRLQPRPPEPPRVEHLRPREGRRGEGQHGQRHQPHHRHPQHQSPRRLAAAIACRMPKKMNPSPSATHVATVITPPPPPPARTAARSRATGCPPHGPATG
jgi:hypothetical protein